MKEVRSKIIPGNGSDYQFQFCRMDDTGKLTFGVEENFNEYITLKPTDENYINQKEKIMIDLFEKDFEFFKKITDMIYEFYNKN